MTRAVLAGLCTLALSGSSAIAALPGSSAIAALSGASATAALPGSSAIAAGSSAAPTPNPASARLDGQFLMAGRVTVAVRIRGEHLGESVKRTWTFTALCSSGPCARIGLERERAAGSDKLVLTRISPGYYGGHGKFYAPLRCAGRLYHRGESVPFTIHVRVSAAATSLSGGLVATRIRASYTNRSRRNLTRCVAIPGHDAATYRGQAVASSGGTGPAAEAASARSPAGS